MFSETEMYEEMFHFTFSCHDKITGHSSLPIFLWLEQLSDLQLI